MDDRFVGHLPENGCLGGLGANPGVDVEQICDRNRLLLSPGNAGKTPISGSTGVSAGLPTTKAAPSRVRSRSVRARV
ncbi:MAG: hypothetical protein AAF921_22605 [Cyanobacteria bacterium P01_D01_bin.44]